MAGSFQADYRIQILNDYREQKRMADEALARVSDEAFFKRLQAGGDDHTNSLAILVKHLGGNLRSRWTDFLTTDGEKSDRFREREFMAKEGESRAEIMQRWERGWQIALATLESLSDADFARTITIRGEPHSVLKAIQRNLLHTTHHVGQIDLLSTLITSSR
jgi:hypothetical protein